jgi:hypothetical protein
LDFGRIKNPSRAETIDIFYKAKAVWGISEGPREGPGGSKENFAKKVTWMAVLKLMPREKRLTRGGR